MVCGFIFFAGFSASFRQFFHFSLPANARRAVHSQAVKPQFMGCMKCLRTSLNGYDTNSPQPKVIRLSIFRRDSKNSHISAVCTLQCFHYVFCHIWLSCRWSEIAKLGSGSIAVDITQYYDHTRFQWLSVQASSSQLSPVDLHLLLTGETLLSNHTRTDYSGYEEQK
jgi:hypothetical protein